MVIRTGTPTGLAKEFDTLSREWKEACAFTSSTSEMISHPAYQAIIALGPPVVPLLLQDLAKETAHWFEALQAITGEDAVSPRDWGNVSSMATAWLAWGRSKNL